MTQYTYTKQINSLKLIEEIKEAGLMSINYIDTVDNVVLIYFNSGLSTAQKSTLDSVVSSHSAYSNTQIDMVNKAINEAIAFGFTLQREFVTENILLGITQRGLTGHIRKALREVKDAIETGSLYDAITEIKNLDSNDFDDVVLTAERLLTFRNKIETYLNVPLAEAWDDPETWL